eukprot:TRINITY_DN61053_c0_g1_i1.p2 TRINITY_DN61053_c0_g1~~TRINITY_DN61053_c0_g1_i1.p2  ORF type:complete len:170 (+),score=12.66 TRINITY_DN61053_c0_g1_i1:135-644(+)
MDRVRGLFSGDEAELGLIGQAANLAGGGGEDTCCPALSFTQRLTGFAICGLSGVLFSLIAWTFWYSPSKFAFFFTTGNLLGLISTVFLVGPRRHLEMMWEETRRVAVAVYLLSMMATLVAIFFLHSALLSLVMIVCQYVAFAWYCLTFIPYGRETISGCLGGLTSSFRS